MTTTRSARPGDNRVLPPTTVISGTAVTERLVSSRNATGPARLLVSGTFTGTVKLQAQQAGQPDTLWVDTGVQVTDGPGTGEWPFSGRWNFRLAGDPWTAGSAICNLSIN